MAPTIKPVSLAEAKAHLREDEGDSDQLIETYIAAAVARLDGYGGILGRALMRQDWREYLPSWPACREIELRLAPVMSILSVTVKVADGSVVTVDPARYRLLAAATRPTLLLDDALPWPGQEPDAIAITYRAGYGETAEALPPPLRSAILLMVGDLYRYRATATLGAAMEVPMSMTVNSLISPFRRGCL